MVQLVRIMKVTLYTDLIWSGDVVIYAYVCGTSSVLGLVVIFARTTVCNWGYVCTLGSYRSIAPTIVMQEIRLMIPNAQRLNRGHYVVGQLVEACRANDVTDLVIIHEHRGIPGECYHIGSDLHRHSFLSTDWEGLHDRCVYVIIIDSLVICHLPYGPTATFTIYNTVMRHDIPNVGTMSEAFPHLIFHNFKTKLGERVRLLSVCMQSIIILCTIQNIGSTWDLSCCSQTIPDNHPTMIIMY